MSLEWNGILNGSPPDHLMSSMQQQEATVTDMMDYMLSEFHLLHVSGLSASSTRLWTPSVSAQLFNTEKAIDKSITLFPHLVGIYGIHEQHCIYLNGKYRKP